MKTKILLMLAAIVAALSITSSGLKAQLATNSAALEAFAVQKEIEFLEKQQRVSVYAAEHGITPWQEYEDGTVIQLMDVVDGKPVYNITHNVGAAITTRADRLWEGGSSGLEISGEGYDKLGEWDGGATRVSHQEFTDNGLSRVIQSDNATSLSAHATHVAGTLVGGGVNIEAKGMLYKGLLKAYDWNNAESEMAAAASQGLEISNHSYGWITGWHSSNGSWSWYGNDFISDEEDWKFGFYGDRSRDWDIIAYNAPNYLITKSAGNDRGQGPSYAGQPGFAEKDGGADGFDCISDGGISKNILTVGAVQEVLNYTGPSSVLMSGFSSWGPADDGRIKPDVVGKGVGVYSSTSSSNSSYSSLNGTSMSSPNVAGTMALLQYYYQQTQGGVPMRASTLKALVIHTADEAGPHTGPDYMYGWGLVNAERAANIISEDNVMQNVIDEIVLNDGDTYERVVSASGNQPFMVTIVWTDVPGTVPPAALNARVPVIVNDLDLRIEDSDGNLFYPYQLDPDNPTAAATTDGKNFVDNVEQVFIAEPEAADYTIIVDHDGPLTNDLQVFSIIISGIDEHTGVPLCSNGLISPADGSDGHSVVQEIRWSPAPFASSYDIYLGTDGQGLETPTNIINGENLAQNYLVVDGLEINETYYIQVIPRNNQGANETCEAIWSFATMPAISEYPYLMDVQDAMVPNLPKYWQQLNTSKSQWRSIAVPGSAGSKAMACMNNSNVVLTHFDTWLISQPLQVVAGNEYWLSFTYRSLLPGTAEDMSVYWGPEPAIEMLTNPVLQLIGFEETDWVIADALVIPEADGFIYLSWHAHTEGGYGMLVDDVMVYDWGLVSTSELAENTVRIVSEEGELIIKAHEAFTNATLSVMNAAGQIVHQAAMQNTRQYRRQLKLSPGIYIVTIQDGGAVTNQKVFVR
jgi:hypothetical protein